MNLLNWIGRIFARFVGLLVGLLGAWIFGINAYEAVTESNGYDPSWVLAVVLLAGLLSAAGGVLFLLSLDGPDRFQTPKTRLLGIILMVSGSFLPTSLTLVLLPLSLLMLTTLKSFPNKQQPFTSE